METILSAMPNRRNFLKGKYTVEIGYPWLTYGAIVELEEIIKPDFNILEFGSGGSTIFFSKRCNSIKSIDSNPVWTKRIRKVLPESSNVHLLCCDFYEIMYIIEEEPDEYYDLVLADSVPYDARQEFILVSVSKIKKGGYLVVDNYNNKHLRNYDYAGFVVFTYDSIGHSGKGTRICVKQ